MFEIIIVAVIAIVAIVAAVGSFVKEKKNKKQAEKPATFGLTAEQLKVLAEKEGWQERIADDTTKTTYERLTHYFDTKYGKIADFEKSEWELWDEKKQEILNAFKDELKRVKAKTNSVNKMSTYDKYPGVNIYWRLGLPPEKEGHCSDCPLIAAGSPYNKSNPLPSYPATQVTVIRNASLTTIVHFGLKRTVSGKMKSNGRIELVSQKKRKRWQGESFV